MISLLFVQYGVAVHASEHMFHEHEDACDSYLNAERASHSLIPASISLLIHDQRLLFIVVDLSYTCDCDQPTPQSRDPPAVLS